ncbi:hypothetical protein BGX34_006358 [Mortierella sp. NVP85]|nr:hypothetical protein BGX34_006358 [Mortierella sp. NVP85]
MAHIGPSQALKQEGILCGNLEGAFIYNLEANTLSGTLSQEFVAKSSQSSMMMDYTSASGQDNERQFLFRIQDAGCSSVSFDPVSRQWMASYKFLGRTFTQHVRGTLDQDPNGGLVLKNHITVSGGPPVPTFSRSSVFSRQDGVVCMAAGSEGETYVWYDPSQVQSQSQSKAMDLGIASSSQPLAGDGTLERLVLHGQGSQKDRRSEPVKDVKPVVIGHEDYLVTLSDKELELYRWTETQSEQGEGEETEDSEIEDDEGWTGDENQEWQNKGKKRRVDA